MQARLFLTTAILLLSMMAKAQGIGVYILDNDGNWTNVRNAPKGKVVFKLPAREGVMIEVDHQENGWWRLVNPVGFTGDEKITMSGSTTGYWVHWSVVAVGTRNYGGQKLTLRQEASEKSAVVFTFTKELQLRVLDIKGKWVKVRTIDGKYTGWIDINWLCGNSLTNCC